MRFSGLNKVLVERSWITANFSGRKIIDKLFKVTRVNEFNKKEYQRVVPIENKVCIIKNQRDLLFIIIIEEDTTSSLPFQFLESFVHCLEQFLGQVSEKTIKSNFSLIYLCIEEMCINGIPCLEEPAMLKMLISPPSLKNKLYSTIGNSSLVSSYLPRNITSALDWRSKGIKYSKEEILIDIIEEITCVFNTKGTLLKSSVIGKIFVKSQLSGMPEVSLFLKNREEIEDYSCHKCVKLNTFMSEKVLQFVPPDGEFILMKYTLRNIPDKKMKLILPLDFTSQSISNMKSEIPKRNIRFSISGNFNSPLFRKTNLVNFGLHNKMNGMEQRRVKKIKCVTKFPRVISSISNASKSNSMEVSFSSINSALNWSLVDLSPEIGKDRSCIETIVHYENEKKMTDSVLEVQVNFEVENTLVSDIDVSQVKVFGHKEVPHKGVKLLTKGKNLCWRYKL
eukprot:snap_masked-scaffold_7-processed-gene-9.18-mRNA-1 protein AED:1.00 eAED:1.00 QI:0/0/0/0/1/1/6/0/450